MGILALIAEFENDIRREHQMDGIAKAKDRGVKFGRKRELTDDKAKEIRTLREAGETVPTIIKRTGFSKASILSACTTASSDGVGQNRCPALSLSASAALMPASNDWNFAPECDAPIALSSGKLPRPNSP